MIENGTQKEIDGCQRVYFHGHWILFYKPPEENWANHKILIDHLTRRAFHNTERGINTPGEKLEMARAAYENENDPGRKRVNAAMLAGALFNRASDIFNSIVSLAERGVTVTRENDLMKRCSACFFEALELGKQVKHYSGEEGIDEVWGEPFRAFTLSIEDFYRQRYIKMAAAMNDIDLIVDAIQATLGSNKEYQPVNPLLEEFKYWAKREMETMKSDPRYFEIWPGYASTLEQLVDYDPGCNSDRDELFCLRSKGLLKRGVDLINWIAAARVQMPKSRDAYLQALNDFNNQP
ncbi:MAG: hypothetical protein HWE20_13755 [Gammaproteobacteria bacterium]|nr:hypothetical protein [Gammaproteobacteria bacterium]